MASSYPASPDALPLPVFSQPLGQAARPAGAVVTDLTDAVKAVQSALGSTSAAGTLPLVRKGDLTVNARDYATLSDAVAAVASGGTVWLPRGTYNHTGNLTIATDSVTLRGDGDGTVLAFSGGGLVFDGSTTYTTEVGVYNLRVSRSGSAGPAIRLKGGGAGTGVAHFNANNVRVASSTGEGLLIDGSYIATFVGCYFIGCATTGIKVAVDSIGGTVTGNNISFFGGETQGCAVAANLSNPIGVSFYGHAFEGSTTSGVELPAGAYGVNFLGCYFEANAGWDLKVGTTANCYPTSVKGCTFLDATAGKTDAIHVIRSRGLSVEDTVFNGYGGPPVTVNEASAGIAQGHVRNCWDGTAGDLVTLNGATLFNKHFLGYHGSTGIQQHIAASGVLDFGSIAAHAHADLTMTVTGAATGDDVSVHTTNLDTGIAPPFGWVSAANTVTVRLMNYSASAVDPSARTFRVRVWR